MTNKTTSAIDEGRIVPPHYSGPGEEVIPKPRAPFAYPGRNSFRNDPDETEGRRLYRAYANAEAALAMALARRIKLKRSGQ
jgi:hypothetical protein